MPEVQPEEEFMSGSNEPESGVDPAAADRDEEATAPEKLDEGAELEAIEELAEIDPAALDLNGDDEELSAPGPRLATSRGEQAAAEDDDDEEEPDDDGRRRRPWAQPRVEGTIEAMLFASPDVLGFRQIRSILPDEKVSNEAIRAGLKALEERYQAKGSGIVLVEISGGYQIQTREEHFEFVQSLAKTRTEEKITQAALETLAIIAYKQPITRAEVDAIRGVGSGQIVRTLMDKKMVKVVGRVDLPGRPFQYGTTKQFLDHFGLKGLKDLPRGKEL